MTILAITIAALIAGGAIGVGVLGGVLAILALELLKTAKEQMLTAVSHRVISEERARQAELASSAVAKAIETSALPWFPKTEKLEARYENEAIDRLENPSFYADVVDGLGGTK